MNCSFSEEALPEDLRDFIRSITLFLQQHTNYNAEKIEPMFQWAYRLYVKYKVEDAPGESVYAKKPGDPF